MITDEILLFTAVICLGLGILAGMMVNKNSCYLEGYEKGKQDEHERIMNLLKERLKGEKRTGRGGK